MRLEIVIVKIAVAGCRCGGSVTGLEWRPEWRTDVTSPMYLEGVENFAAAEPHATMFAQMRSAGIPIPQILHLFAYKPRRTDHLARFTQEVMRGPSPLPPGQRELIAALTSKLNQCLF